VVLVGRDSERHAVDRVVAAARVGDGGVLALTGEAGVGKTALLDHARTRFDGFRVVQATGTEQEQGIGFSGLLSLVRPALPLLPRIPAPQAAALEDALALRQGSGGDRFAIGAATLSLLSRYAEDGPLAVVVDDLHLLDPPSAEAVVFAARRLAADPVVVLLAARSGECDDLLTGLPALRLTGLDAEESRRLLRAREVSPLTEDRMARLLEVTGGNPLALLELGRDPDVLDHSGPVAPPPVPASLVSAYTRRLHRLPASTRAALLVAVVADGDLRLVGAACRRLGLDPSRLAHAEDDDLVSVSAGRVVFRHPLVRAAVYGDAPSDQRDAAHRVVAGLLPAGDTDRRAWHLAAATWAPDAEVARMLVTAAEHAAARSAYAVAASAYERAAGLSPAAGEHADALTRAAEAAWAAGLTRRTEDLLGQLDGLPLVSGAAVRQVQLRASVAARTGSLPRALVMLEEAASGAEVPELRVALLADAVRVMFYLGDAEAARRLAGRLEVAVRGATAESARAIGMTAAGMAKVLTGQGGAEEIRAAVPLLARSAELRADPARLAWLMLAPLFLRDSGSGAQLRRLVEEVRSRAGIGTLPNLLFHVARDQAGGRAWTRAEANYAEAIRLARETGQHIELAMSLAGLAWLESRQGRAGECREHAAEARAWCEALQVRLGETWVLFALGDLALAEGDAAGAVDHLERLEECLARLGIGDVDLFPGPELVEALLRVGRPARAQRVAADHEERARAKGRPWALARAHRARGLVASEEQLDVSFRLALELHEQTPDDFETARTRLAYGARLRRAGHRVDARAELREALELFAGLGATRWAQVAGVELEATGARVPHRAPTGLASLTTQELQVSLLLAEGRTTRETAAALFLSPKTVEYHLRKVYTKLDIRSRAELAAVVPLGRGCR
jgi:DNA-binding CsgD family transcriptional regulator